MSNCEKIRNMWRVIRDEHASLVEKREALQPKLCCLDDAYEAISQMVGIEREVAVSKAKLDTIERVLAILRTEKPESKDPAGKHLYEAGVMYDGRYCVIKTVAADGNEVIELVERMIPNAAKEWQILHIVETNVEVKDDVADEKPEEVTTTTPAIMRFRGDYMFLSNFYQSAKPFLFEGIEYRNAEAAFQGQKTYKMSERLAIAKLPAAKAKACGRCVSLRPDWDLVKDDIMRLILEAKFSDNALRRKLVATGDAALIECNDWGDAYWGVDSKTGIGENRLGKILMDIRDNFVKKDMWVFEVVYPDGNFVRLRSGSEFYSERQGKNYRFIGLEYDSDDENDTIPLIVLEEPDRTRMLVNKEWFYDTRVFV